MEIGPDRSSNRLEWLAYAALAIAFSYPLAVNLTSRLLGDGDAWLFVWNMWWMRQAWEQGGPLFCTNAISFPSSDCSYLHTWAYPLTALSVPFQHLFSRLTLYNLFAWISFPLAAMGMNRLALFLGSGRWGAFAAGLAFAFAPYHFAHALGHLNLVYYGWIPFALLSFLRGRKKGRTLLRVASLAGWLILIALTDWYYLVFTLMGLLLLATTRQFNNSSTRQEEMSRRPKGVSKGPEASPGTADILSARTHLRSVDGSLDAPPRERRPQPRDETAADSGEVARGPVPGARTSCPHSAGPAAPLKPPQPVRRWLAAGGIVPLTAAAVLTLLVLSPLILSMVRQSSRVPPVGVSNMVSADLQSFFFPGEVSSYGALLHGWNRSWRAGAGETGTFLPWSLLAIALFGWWSAPRRRKWGTALWIGLFGALSLGPFLQVGGQVLALPLPYRLIQEIPLLNIMRSPIRFHVMTLIGLCLLYGWGTRGLVRRFGGTAGLAAALLVTIELAAVPLSMSKPNISPFYRELAKNSDKGALIDLHYPAKAAFYQTVHHRPFLSDGSVFSRASTNALSILNESPVREIVRENRLLAFGNGWPLHSGDLGAGQSGVLPAPSGPYLLSVSARLERSGTLRIQTARPHELWVDSRFVLGTAGISEMTVSAGDIPAEIRLRTTGQAGQAPQGLVRTWLDGRELSASSPDGRAVRPLNPIYGQRQEGLNWYVYPILSETIDAAPSLRHLRDLGFGWIVIPSYANDSFVRSRLRLPPVYQDRFLRAYRLAE